MGKVFYEDKMRMSDIPGNYFWDNCSKFSWKGWKLSLARL